MKTPALKATPLKRKATDNTDDGSVSGSATKKKRRRGGLPTKQEILEKLKNDIVKLCAKPGNNQELFGTVQWGKFYRNAAWLPCVVIRPSHLQEVAHLQLAKAALSSKRKVVVVYWVKYGILSKQLVQNLLPFNKKNDNPNKDEIIPKRTEEFIKAAKEYVTKLIKDNNIDSIDLLGTSSIGSNDPDDEDEAVCVVKRGRKPAAAVDDPFEPAWVEFTQASHKLARFASTSTGEKESSSSDDAESSDAESEGEEYIPDSVSFKRKRKKKKDKKKKRKKLKMIETILEEKPKDSGKKEKDKEKEKEKEAPVEKLRRYAKKLRSFVENPKEHTDSALKALKRLGKFDITSELIKETNIGKDVAKLSKHENETVKQKANAVRKLWIEKLKQKK